MVKFLLFAILASALAAPLCAQEGSDAPSAGGPPSVGRPVDGVSIESGIGDRQAAVVRAGAQWNWRRRWLESGGWHLGGYWDFSVGHWHGGPKDFAEIGFTPTFRWQRSEGGSPYLEAAIGLHVLDSVHVAEDRSFSSRFQFGDHIGAGFRFGERNRWDLGVRLQHLSNAGIRNPNPGINFLQLRLQRHFD
jgi:hypothetical protein